MILSTLAPCTLKTATRSQSVLDKVVCRKLRRLSVTAPLILVLGHLLPTELGAARQPIE
jgi:hypothetical protein